MRETRRSHDIRVLPSATLLAVFLAACGGGGKSAASGAPTAGIDAPEEHITAPIAVVNGVTVYRSTYDAILDALRERIPPGDPDSVERYIGARDLALDKSIDEELLFQEAVRKGYGPTKEEIASLYADRVRKAGSEEKLLSEARNTQLSKSELLYSFRRSIAIDRYIKAEIESKLETPDNEVRAFYETRPELFTPEKWLKVGQIFVNAPLDWPREKRSDALTRLSRGLDKIRGGQSFESVAREISEDGAESDGGMLGFVKRGGMAEQLDRAVFELQPGQMSGIVETEKGYHVLKVYEAKGGQLEPFDKVKDRAKEALFRKKRSDALVAVVRALRDSAKIERLAT